MPLLLVHVFLTLSSAAQEGHQIMTLIRLGVAIPGFFADQSTEVLEYSFKTIYLTALWTAHVCTVLTKPLPSVF